jgi:hypothetical protein
MEEYHDSRAPLLDDVVGSCKRDATMRTEYQKIEKKNVMCVVKASSVKKSTGSKT